MSLDPSLAVQKAILDVLKGATAAGANVYDAVPTADPFPRITIGEGQALPNHADCMRGSELFIDVHVWSRKIGFSEAKGIADQVRTLIDDATLSVTGHVVDIIEFDSARHLRDPDGLTSHIAMTFRALTQPVTT